MNKKQLMMLFSLVFLLSVFAVGAQSGATASTKTTYQTIEMSLSNNPLYSTTSVGQSGGSSCTASSTYSSFSLNPDPTPTLALEASIGYMAFDGFVNEENGTYIPFKQDTNNLSIEFPRDGDGQGESPNFVDWSGDFQDRSPDWANITAVFQQGTPNPLTNTTAVNYLAYFDQFQNIVNLTSSLQNPLVVAELHWMDCDAIFESDLVVNGFYNETNHFVPIRVNDTTSKFIDFSDVQGEPSLLFTPENWYQMPQLNMSVTGVWNVSNYNISQSLDQNIQNTTSNILQSWEAGNDGPEWVELTGFVSNTSDLIVSVKFFFQNDCSCERWYAVDETHGDPIFTTLVNNKGAVNFTEIDFGFWEDTEYHRGPNDPWKRQLKSVYLANEYDYGVSPQNPQPSALDYYDGYVDYENVVYLKLNGSTQVESGTQVVLIVVESYCPPPPPCGEAFADIYVSGWYDENNTLHTFRATGNKLDIGRDYFDMLVNKVDDPDPSGFNFDKPVIRSDVVGVFVNSTYDFSKLFFDSVNNPNNLFAYDGPGELLLTSAPGDSVDLLVVFQYWYEKPCGPSGCWSPYVLDHLKNDMGVENQIYPVFELGKPLIRLYEYGWHMPYNHEVLGVYNYTEFDFLKDPIENQFAYNYLDWFDGADNKIWLLNDNGIWDQTRLAIVMVDRNCPCEEGRVIVGMDGYYDPTNTKFGIYATGTQVDLSNIIRSDSNKPSFLFEEMIPSESPQWENDPREIKFYAVFSNNTYNFGVGWNDQTGTNYFSSYDEFTQKLQLNSAPGDSTPLILIAEVVWKCGCFPTEAEIGTSVFYNEQTNTEVFVYATGNVVNLPDARPEIIHFFNGKGPNMDQEPSKAEILGVFVNATYNFNTDWFSQGNNLLQSYNEMNHQITLTSAPGDSVELLIVMKLFWYCDADCANNQAPNLVSHSPNEQVYAPVDSSYVLKLKFEDDVHNNHSVWKVWMADKFLEGTWTGNELIIDIKFGDHFTVVEGLEVKVEVDAIDDCGATGAFDLFVKFTDNPPVTSDPISTSGGGDNSITTSPGFELFAILFGLAVFGITIRRRN